MKNSRLAIGVATSLALGGPVMAQMGPQPGGPPQEGAGARHLPAQAAEQCLMDLDAFTRRANQEGYWLTGWGTQGPPWMAARAATGVMTPGAPGTAAAPPPITRGPAVTAEQGVVAPRGRPEAAAEQLTGGSHLLPRVQIRALVYAASILGHRGAERGARRCCANSTRSMKATSQPCGRRGLGPANSSPGGRSS